MSHREQVWFVERVRLTYPGFFRGKRVLEIGSLDINGSVRSMFDNCRHTGVDLAPGPGVDVVASGHEVEGEPWDVVCSCEMFEHNPLWAETWRRMVDLCRPGGLVFFSCATTGRPEHGTARTTPADSPLTVTLGWEHYRNLTEDDFRSIIDVGKEFSDYRFEINHSHRDLYFHGLKKA